MTHRWQKLGQLYCPPPRGNHPKLLTHAANPLPLHLSGNTYRVFFSARDNSNRSSVGAVDIDIVERRVLKVFDEPLFEHGPTGSFYADGVSIGNCYEVGGQRYMLFMGWQSPPGKHWRGDIGRLIVAPDHSLELDSATPLIASDSIDPISLSYPWVIADNEQKFEMWYGSTLTWDAGNGEMIHVLNRATSKDGNTWRKHGLAVPYQIGCAQAFSRPTVLRDSTGLHMWFSYRSGKGETYRIGYAGNDDELSWKLNLMDCGIGVSATGWDSEMVAYPAVFRHHDQVYMLYNGNGFGLTGFGLAVLEYRQSGFNT